MLGDGGGTDRELGREFATAVTEFLTGAEITGWAPYATEQIRHLGERRITRGRPTASSW